jgi:hypothetical protein
MENTSEYGIICSADDEKKLVKNINFFEELLAANGFETKLLHSYKEGEDRL